MMCPKCGKEMEKGYLFSSKDDAFSFANEVPGALENAKKAEGFVKLTGLKVGGRISVEACRCDVWDTGKINIHVQNVAQDISAFTGITVDALFEKVRQIFVYSLHNETIRNFRRMMTIEQFRSPELASLYSKRYVERMIDYHAGIFRALIAVGEIPAGDPDTLAMMYVAPVMTLIGVCDRQPEKESECLEKLRNHVDLFFRMVHGCNTQGGENK